MRTKCGRFFVLCVLIVALHVGLAPSEIKKLKKEEMDSPITNEDFLEAMKRVSSSVGKNDLTKFDQWFEEFGSA